MFHLREGDPGHLLDDELGDAVASKDLVVGIGVGVEQQDADLVAIARVDGTGRVETRHTVAQGQAATGLDEAGPSFRQGQGHAGGHQGAPPTGRQPSVFPSQQIGSCITGAGVGRNGQIRIEADHGDLQHGVQPTIRSMLVWMDLEMTGLDPGRHTIVEIATLVTDDDLEVVAEGPDLVVHQPPETLASMNDTVRDMHTRSGLLAAIEASTITLEEAGSRTLAFLEEHVAEPRSVPLCGNSIGTDRRFLAAYLPKIEDYLHYRSIDVSTIKELARRWYPGLAAAAPRKAGGHRALDDVEESVVEMRYYRQALFRSPDSLKLDGVPPDASSPEGGGASAPVA